jgi:hypothetical protein
LLRYINAPVLVGVIFTNKFRQKRIPKKMDTIFYSSENRKWGGTTSQKKLRGLIEMMSGHHAQALARLHAIDDICDFVKK